MATFTQAILLGAERLATAPVAPHAALGEAWANLDWAGSKETAWLEAAAVVGLSRSAGAVARAGFQPSRVAPTETTPVATLRATAVLRRLLAEEWRALLPEWLEQCARQGMRVPPFFLRALFETIQKPEERTLLVRVIGERGHWLAQQNPAWSWVLAATPQPDPAWWETGSEEERLARWRHVRATERTRAFDMLAATWSDEAPEFRERALGLLASDLGSDDEPLLIRGLGDRRKDVRATAQRLLARLPGSALAARMREHAQKILFAQRGLLSRRLEVNLPPSFDPVWKTDGIEEKPPAGVGEKAFWTQQIISLVPFAYWRNLFEVDSVALVALAVKSGEWTELLLGAWFRAAVIHRDGEAAAALLRPLLARPKALAPGTTPAAAATALLAVCNETERWRIAALEPELAWIALPLLTGTPDPVEGRALFDHLSSSLRDGLNPGGSAAAVLAALRTPIDLRDEASLRLARENGLSKPAEAFLQALELRAELHAAFSSTSHVNPP
jgi:hypothetical protein